MTGGPAALWWSQAAHAALDLLVPQTCAGCGAPGRAWCLHCQQATGGSALWVPGPVPIRAAAEHSGPVGRAVVGFKDGQVRQLGAPLGTLLAGAVAAALADADVPGRPRREPIWLVPVPSRRDAVRARGADHMAVLAARAAAQLRRAGFAAHRLRCLELTRATHDQVGLSGAQRRGNLAGALRSCAVPAGALVVVDDVATTGATLCEAIRALQAAGGQVRCAGTITRAGPPTRRRASATGAG